MILGFPEQNKDFAIQNMGEWGGGGYHFVSIAHSISSFLKELISSSIKPLRYRYSMDSGS